MEVKNLTFVSEDRFKTKLGKPGSTKSPFISVVYEAKGMKFCAYVLSACLDNLLVLDFCLLS